jgi:hypothetical protein
MGVYQDDDSSEAQVYFKDHFKNPTNTQKIFEGDILYILVHEGSYQNEIQKAKVSFFIQKQGNKEKVYLFTISNILLPKEERLYTFFAGGGQDTEIKMEYPIVNGMSYLPKQLKFVEKINK